MNTSNRIRSDHLTYFWNWGRFDDRSYYMDLSNLVVEVHTRSRVLTIF